MSEVQDILKADSGQIGELGQVLGTGGGANTGQEGTQSSTNPGSGLGGDGIGNTFLTEPLHAQFVALLEEASFVRQIAKTIPMTQPTLRVPAITSGLQVFYQEEQGVEAVETQMSAGDFTLEARKIMAQVIATAELYEDSQQNIEQIITSDFVRAIAQAEEQAFLLGRQTAVGGIPKGSTTGSAIQSPLPAVGAIGSLTNFVRDSGGGTAYAYDHWGTQTGAWSSGTAEGSEKIATSPLKICDGVVTTALDEGTIVDMQGASFRGQLAYKAIREAIFKMGLLGRDRGDLILVLNPVASNQLLQSDELMTLDKYGSNATILTGEVGSLFGVKILESSFLPSNGVVIDGTTTYGQGGYGVLVHKPSLLLGDLRKVQVENERIIQNDAYRTVISERLAFGMERRNGAVAIGNIASDVSSLSSGTSVFVAGGLKPSIGGASAVTILKDVANDLGSTNLDLNNLEVGETTSLVVSSISVSEAVAGTPDITNATIGNLELNIDATSVSGDLTPVGDAIAGSVSSLGTIASQAGTVTITFDVDTADLAFAGALTTADVTYRLALYDGAQYSDVHVFVVTVNNA